MLKNHLADLLFQKFNYPPTPGQKRLIEILAGFLTDDCTDKVLIIKGYAGTGKTTVISTLVNVLDSLGQKSVLLAPTGRAAKILASYSGKNANTIHKRIYRQKSAGDSFGVFVPDRNLFVNTLFLVDEASMITNQSLEKSVFGSGRLLDDLIQYIKNGENCRLIIIGDTAQLPPVGTSISPALDKTVMQGYFDEAEITELTDVVRQSQDSGILFNATCIRDNIFDKKMQVPQPRSGNFQDIHLIKGDEITDHLQSTYDNDGIENTIVICRSNKRANQYNSGIRSQLLGREEEITSGDLLMVVKNNYYWLNDSEDIDFIANGDIARIVSIRKIQELYGFRFADVVLDLIDYEMRIEAKVILNTLTSESAALSSEDNQKLFYAILEDYQDLQPRKSQYQKVKTNAFFNALQVKFAYAITCHKAQGGQWKNVFMDASGLRVKEADESLLRWLYTAYTRATDNLYLINFPAETEKSG